MINQWDRVSIILKFCHVNFAAKLSAKLVHTKKLETIEKEFMEDFSNGDAGRVAIKKNLLKESEVSDSTGSAIPL